MPRLVVILFGSVALLTPLFSPWPALAHPGHALGGAFGLVHYLLDPSHGGMLPIAVVLGTGALVWLLGNRRPRLRPARAGKPKSKDRERQTERS